jgi:hypothetical protein
MSNQSNPLNIPNKFMLQKNYKEHFLCKLKKSMQKTFLFFSPKVCFSILKGKKMEWRSFSDMNRIRCFLEEGKKWGKLFVKRIFFLYFSKCCHGFLFFRVWIGKELMWKVMENFDVDVQRISFELIILQTQF